MVQVSWKPRVYFLRQLLSPEECDHLVSLAAPGLTKSAVVDSDTGGWFDSEVRTSSGTFFAKQQDPIIARVEKRISLVTHLPEGMQTV